MKPSSRNTYYSAVLAAAVLVFVLPGCAARDEGGTSAGSDTAAHDVATQAAAGKPVLEPPSILFGDFFETVAMSGLFVDSKQWTDALPKYPPAEIVARAEGVDTSSPQALGDFLNENFDLNPAAPAGAAVTPRIEPAPQPDADPTLPVGAAVTPRIEPARSPTTAPRARLPICAHIEALWPQLTRESTNEPPWSSRLPLPYPYVVPGGRFREVYYWDSYFTMLGLDAELRRSMVQNFAHEIRSYGHIPNGNRTYYLSRSQPPFFYGMVGLLAPGNPAAAYAEFLDVLRAEHDFWMEGAEESALDRPVRRVVTMPDDSQLNRYWDARDVPRDESYREDVESAQEAGDIDRARFYRDIRAAAESGWDFSSRWFADGKSIETTRTTSIVPVDLNSLLYGLEQAIAAGCREAGDGECANRYETLAGDRRAAMHRYLWNEEIGVYDDRLWTEDRLLGHVTAATLYPLFAGLATDTQAARIAGVVREDLLAEGGIVTTTHDTGEQWDAPNGWAPLQWIAVKGLRDYGEPELAEAIAERWLALVTNVYAETGKLLEKYNVVNLVPGGGGEYPLQDGFGWTNGVTVGLYRLYPSEECPAKAALTPQP
ncbi:MAG TPA: alpha,alpha-trehalase TreF [Woeseiaceae bacterium]|nr:alpha,alpha-trehalase TreF [Woeseiaceae bacterium]